MKADSVAAPTTVDLEDLHIDVSEGVEQEGDGFVGYTITTTTSRPKFAPGIAGAGRSSSEQTMSGHASGYEFLESET